MLQTGESDGHGHKLTGHKLTKATGIAYIFLVLTNPEKLGRGHNVAADH